mmetsp:Transcript_9671/g.28543  ORF Transcript_9671/g.28543 Transcript_9671/m.28543 type:complete len:171 (-) Transcript_9671:76-588(-)
MPRRAGPRARLCQALVLLLPPLGAAEAGADRGQGRGTVLSSLAEEVKAFESGAGTMDTEGWKAFLATSAHSARSALDQTRTQGTESAVSQDRSYEVSLSDHFAGKIEENNEFPTLRQLAKEHWDGLSTKPKAAKALDAKVPPPPPAQAAPGAGPGSLRSLLRSAGGGAGP